MRHLSPLRLAVAAASFLLLGLGGQGCVTHALTLQMTPHFEDYRASWGTDVTLVSEGCGALLFGVVPISGDASLATAMADLLGQAEGRPLAYVTVDVRTSFYVLVTEECTVVTGHFIDPTRAQDRGPSGLPRRSSNAGGGERETGTAATPPPEATAGTRDDDAPFDPEPAGEGPGASGVRIVTFAGPGGLRAARHALKAWVGRQVEATHTSGATTRGKFHGIRQGTVVLRTTDGGLWEAEMLEVMSIRLLE